jgi:hypothetical protein
MEKNLNIHRESKVEQRDVSSQELVLQQLELKILELKDIADEMNPYEPLPLSLKARLEKWGIPISTDPFRLTNTLLLTMEDSIDKRSRLRRELELDPNAPLKDPNTSHLKH